MTTRLSNLTEPTFPKSTVSEKPDEVPLHCSLPLTLRVIRGRVKKMMIVMMNEHTATPVIPRNKEGAVKERGGAGRAGCCSISRFRCKRKRNQIPIRSKAKRKKR